MGFLDEVDAPLPHPLSGPESLRTAFYHIVHAPSVCIRLLKLLPNGVVGGHLSSSDLSDTIPVPRQLRHGSSAVDEET